MKDLREARFVPMDGSKVRRWFSNENFDLIVWHDAAGEITGFQLCYGKPHDEQAIVWKKKKGFSHHRVDSGEDTPLKNRSPVLRVGGTFNADLVMKEFKDSCKSIDPIISDFVFLKLKEYSTHID